MKNLGTNEESRGKKIITEQLQREEKDLGFPSLEDTEAVKRYTRRTKSNNWKLKRILLNCMEILQANPHIIDDDLWNQIQDSRTYLEKEILEEAEDATAGTQGEVSTESPAPREDVHKAAGIGRENLSFPDLGDNAAVQRMIREIKETERQAKTRIQNCFKILLVSNIEDELRQCLEESRNCTYYLPESEQDAAVAAGKGADEHVN